MRPHSFTEGEFAHTFRFYMYNSARMLMRTRQLTTADNSSNDRDSPKSMLRGGKFYGINIFATFEKPNVSVTVGIANQIRKN